jgi:hypothetical protein
MTVCKDNLCQMVVIAFGLHSQRLDGREQADGGPQIWQGSCGCGERKDISRTDDI